MNKDEIIRMAREAGMAAPTEIAYNNFWTADQKDLERFAKLVAAEEQKRLEATAWGLSKRWIVEAVAYEREECAKVCEEQRNMVAARHPARVEFDPDSVLALKCAAAIRARGEK